MSKLFVDVIAYYDCCGNISPIAIHWSDGREFAIDKVCDVRRAASLKSGGSGVRYTCRIRGQIRYLYLDDNKWFLERVG